MAFDLESLSEATSGAIGALVSTTVLYPLDTCKNKYQAEVRSHNRQKYSRACAVIVTQPLDTASSRMQTSAFGKSKGLWKTLSEGTWSEAFDALGISLLLTTNPSIQMKMMVTSTISCYGFMLYVSGNHQDEELYDKYCAVHCILSVETETSKGAAKQEARYRIILGLTFCCICVLVGCSLQVQGDDSGCRIRRRQEEGGSTEIPKNSIRCNPNDLEKGRATWFLQRIRCSDFEDCVKLSIAFDGEGEITKTTWVLLLALQSYLFIAKTRLKSA
ncbi:unnamed protein product [Camellia sinensis]